MQKQPNGLPEVLKNLKPTPNRLDLTEQVEKNRIEDEA